VDSRGRAEQDRVDDRPGLPIAEANPREPLAIAIEPDAARKLLIDWNRGQRDRLAHGHVLLPSLERLRLAAIWNDLVLVFHDAGFQRDDGIGDLKRRGLDETPPRALSFDPRDSIRGPFA